MPPKNRTGGVQRDDYYEWLTTVIHVSDSWLEASRAMRRRMRGQMARRAFSNDVAEPLVRTLPQAPATPGARVLGGVGGGGGSAGIVGAEASPELHHPAAVHGAPVHAHLLPWPPPNSLSFAGPQREPCAGCFRGPFALAEMPLLRGSSFSASKRSSNLSFWLSKPAPTSLELPNRVSRKESVTLDIQ